MSISRFTFAQRLCRYLPPVIAQQVRLRVYPFERAAREDVHFTTTAHTGARFSASTRDRVAWTFALHGYYNWRNVLIAMTLCSAGDTIIEVGGNLGTETLSFADLVGPQGKVFTFEPLPGNIAILQQNIAANNYAGRIQLLPFAVGERCEMAQFVLPPEDNSGTGRLNASSGAAGIEVRCVTLDSMSDEAPAAKAIFMDIEGAEIFALRGARQYLARYRPYVIIEALSPHLRCYGLTLRDLYDELAAQNYAIYNIARFGLEAIAPEAQNLPGGDWCCFPLEKRAAAFELSRILRKAAILPVIKGIHPLAR